MPCNVALCCISACPSRGLFSPVGEAAHGLFFSTKNAVGGGVQGYPPQCGPVLAPLPPKFGVHRFGLSFPQSAAAELAGGTAGRASVLTSSTFPGGGGLGAGGTLENSSVQMINAPLCVQPGEPGSVGGGGRGVETPLAQLCISECLGMCGLWSLSSAKTAGDNEGWARVQGWLRTESCAVSKLASLRKSSAGAECSHPPNHLCHSPQP